MRRLTATIVTVVILCVAAYALVRWLNNATMDERRSPRYCSVFVHHDAVNL
jgi:hypothetical protein